MDREQLKSIFDHQAPSYDQQWSKLAAFRDGLHILLGSIFKELPADARALCIGAGTGAEILFLAGQFPGWTFTVVEPSAGMVEVCRQRALEQGVAERCTFHVGYLESSPTSAAFDAATCLLVSQFILDRKARSDFFRGIAQRLRPGAILASSDLSADVTAPTYPSLLAVWLRTMSGADVTPEGIERMRAAYQQDVAVLPAAEVEEIIVAGGFESPIQFFQAGFIHAWYSRRAPVIEVCTWT
jgi:tRNA (cmo5U34)-methyltransferase